MDGEVRVGLMGWDGMGWIGEIKHVTWLVLLFGMICPANHSHTNKYILTYAFTARIRIRIRIEEECERHG